MTDAETAFLAEYKSLCLKYHQYISACGCCNSPWPTDAKDDEEIERHISHIESEF